jgi:AraC-like DNA-binding protein
MRQLNASDGCHELAETAAAHMPHWVSLQEQMELAQHLAPEDAEAVSAHFGLADFGDAGAATLASTNLRSAIDVMNSVAPLINLRHNLKLHVSQGDVVMTFHNQIKDCEAVRDRLLRLDRAKVLRFLGDLLTTEHLASVRSEIRSCNEQIRIAKSIFLRKLPRASRSRSLQHQRQCQVQMHQLAERAICQRVRQILLRQRDAFPSAAEVAAKLGLSNRTLSRRLAAQQTTYAQILSRIRFELAVQYLMEGRLTTELIALALGYSDTANFRAAFRRWTGVPPSRFVAAARSR